MRLAFLPLLLLAALPMAAHDHGYGCWHHGRPRVVVVERPYWAAEPCGPRVIVRRAWRPCPAPEWVEPGPVYYGYEARRPSVRLEFNLR